MALKEILVHFDESNTRAAKLDAALRLAKRHDAHLTGLFAVTELTMPAYAGVHIPEEVFEHREREIKQSAAAAETEFRASLDGISGEWRFARGSTDREINRLARFADLVVISQANDESLMSASASAEYQVLLGCGRPVLLIPSEGLGATLGERVLLAWDGSLEAARAARDALPVLQQAAQVDVVAVRSPNDDDGLATAEICQFLARHAISAEGHQVATDGLSIGERLLAHASEARSDLIVTGAYGHSRLFEMVLGGVTKTLLRRSSLPVLMSH